MMLAPPKARRNPNLEKAKLVSEGSKPLFHNERLSEKGGIGSELIGKSSIAFEEAQDSSKDSGATPAGVAHATP